MTFRRLAALAALTALAASPAAAEAVTTGVVLRGITLPGPAGASGAAVHPGKTCSFSGDPQDGEGRLTGSSVQCRKDGNVDNTIGGMPLRFNAYCKVNAGDLPRNSRLIRDPITRPPRNANHCDLSGAKAKDANGAFGGAIWR
jgi:hypothetical protein